MAVLEPLDKGIPNLLPSLPPSPSEEDLTKADGIWNDEPAPTFAKWKGKSREVSAQSETAPLGAGEDVPLGSATSEAYPPMNDEDTETRRVEETLRRWEVAERQRRKAARESQVSSERPSSAGSALGDVARRASLLWSSRRSSRPLSGGAGSHAPLHARASVSEDGVQLDTIDDVSPVPSPAVHSPAPSPRTSDVGVASPFDDPAPGSTPGPLMRATSDASFTSSGAGTVREGPTPTPTPPVLEASNSFSGGARGKPPTPAPFDLPAPRSPPPRTATPHASRPPEPLPPPEVGRAQLLQQREEAKAARNHNNRDVRWWSDWVCGCGPARGDDKQDARTNPFE